MDDLRIHKQWRISVSGSFTLEASVIIPVLLMILSAFIIIGVRWSDSFGRYFDSCGKEVRTQREEYFQNVGKNVIQTEWEIITGETGKEEYVKEEWKKSELIRFRKGLMENDDGISDSEDQ